MGKMTPLAVSVLDAVAMTGIGRTALYAAIKTGQLKIRKFGRRTVIEVSALNDWLTSLPSSPPPKRTQQR